jgi:hypothetical protein
MKRSPTACRRAFATELRFSRFKIHPPKLLTNRFSHAILKIPKAKSESLGALRGECRAFSISRKAKTRGAKGGTPSFCAFLHFVAWKNRSNRKEASHEKDFIIIFVLCFVHASFLLDLLRRREHADRSSL